MSEKRLYVVFNVAPVAFCDNIAMAEYYVRAYPEKKLEIKEVPLNVEFSGFLDVPGITSENDWQNMWLNYGGVE